MNIAIILMLSESITPCVKPLHHKSACQDLQLCTHLIHELTVMVHLVSLGLGPGDLGLFARKLKGPSHQQVH